jgi:hypothetical protein
METLFCLWSDSFDGLAVLWSLSLTIKGRIVKNTSFHLQRVGHHNKKASVELS